jgi:phage terminase large subunit GpA-like protein
VLPVEMSASMFIQTVYAHARARPRTRGLDTPGGRVYGAPRVGRHKRENREEGASGPCNPCHP